MNTYLSSENDYVKRSKLNNVICSLDNLISSTTNDKTLQDFGEIEYCGILCKGQVIHGTKPPSVSCVPVFTTSNVFVGYIHENGDLIVENDTDIVGTTSCAVTSKSGPINVEWATCYDPVLHQEYDTCELICSNTTSRTYAECGYNVTCTCTTSCYCHKIQHIINPHSFEVICGNCNRQQRASVICYGSYLRNADTSMFIENGKLCVCMGYNDYEDDHHHFCFQNGCFDIDNERFIDCNISAIKYGNSIVAPAYFYAGTIAVASTCYYITMDMTVCTTSVTCVCTQTLSHCVCIREIYA